MSFIFGAFQTIGVGFYAPCMAMVYALGMHSRVAFPIMMTATAMLMAAGSARFVREGAWTGKRRWRCPWRGFWESCSPPISSNLFRFWS